MKFEIFYFLFLFLPIKNFLFLTAAKEKLETMEKEQEEKKPFQKK